MAMDNPGKLLWRAQRLRLKAPTEQERTAKGNLRPTNATGQLIFDYNDDLNIGALFGSVNADATPELAILLPGVSSLNASSLIL